MGLKIKNGFLLLEQVTLGKSVFAVSDQSDKYVVAFADSDYQTGDVLYLRPGAGEDYRVGDNSYTLATLEDVVAVDAA